MYYEEVNEIEKTGLTAMPACMVAPPRIEECYQHIECRLNQVVRPTENQSDAPPAEREASGSPLEGGVYRLTYLNVEYRTRNIE